MRARGVPYLLQVLGLAIVYAAGAALGQLAAIPPEKVSVVWAPAGIAVAAIALVGSQIWPGIWLGSFAYSYYFFHGDPTIHPATAMGIAIGIATCSAMMALVGRLLVRLGQGREARIETVGDVMLWTLAAGLGAATVSATIGTAILSASGVLPVTFALAWRTWWLGDATGIILLTPGIILWARLRTPKFRPGQELEALIAACAFALVCVIAFATTAPPGWAPYLLALPLAFLSYTALRFGRRVTAATALVVAFVAEWATASMRGPLRAMDPETALTVLQAFLAFGTVLGLTLAAAAHQSQLAPVHAPTLPSGSGPVPRSPTPLASPPLPSLPDAPGASAPAATSSAPAAPSSGGASVGPILAAIPEPAYLLLRESLTVVRCNDPFARALGLAAPTSAESRTLYDLFPAAVALTAADEARRVFSTGEVRESREEWPDGDGSISIVEVRRTPLPGPNGEVYALLARARRLPG